MQIKRLILIAVSLLIILQYSLFSQENGSTGGQTDNPAEIQAAQSSSVDFGFGVGIGAVILDDKVYNSIKLNPDLAIGKFGIGLDIDFRFTLTGDEDGETKFSVYEPDWVLTDGTFQDYLNLYLSKFDYIRWGQSGDDLFAKIGSIESATIGNGFILGGYSNENFKPDRKYTGFRFELDTALFNWPFMGIELFAANISELDLMAARYYIKPLGGIKSPVLSGLEVGATFAVDRNPFFYLEDNITTSRDSNTNELIRDPTTNEIVQTDIANGMYDIYDYADLNNSIFSDPSVAALFLTSEVPETVYVYGLDVMQPLLNIKIFTMALYGDYVLQGLSSPAMGGSVGLGGSLLKFMSWNAGVVIRGDDFIPSYFNRTYDLDRASKYILYQNDHSNPLHEQGMDYKASLGFNFLDGGISFVAQVNGPFASPVLKDPVNAPWEYPHLMALFSIGEGLIPYFDVSFWYDKQGIDSASALVSPENALIGGRVNYKIQSAVLSLQVDVKYDPGLPDEWDVTTKLETAIRF